MRRSREFSSAAARVAVAATSAVLIVLAAASALVPRWIVFAQRPEFEVASVKVNTTNGRSDAVPRISGDLVTMHNTQPYSVIFYAWHLTGSYQMVNYEPLRLPDGWNWYDIEARAGANAADDRIRLMFQSLLADRFKLKVHRETRQLPEFELMLAKGKPKLTPAGDGPMKLTIEGRDLNQRAGTCGVSLWLEGAHLVCHAAAMETIGAAVGGQLQAPLVDRTGLTGQYDINVLFAAPHRKLQSEDDSGPPPLEAAIHETLGLRLEKGKGPVEVIVIDRLEKPSGN